MDWLSPHNSTTEFYSSADHFYRFCIYIWECVAGTQSDSKYCITVLYYGYCVPLIRTVALPTVVPLTVFVAMIVAGVCVGRGSVTLV